MIDYKTHYTEDNEQKLKEIIKIVCQADQGHSTLNFPDINTSALKRVVVSESDKTYLTKKVNEINNEGLFKGFKGLCHKIALVIKEIDSNYQYPHAVVSTILEASHQQAFFAQHLPSLTEIKRDSEKSIELQVCHFIDQFIFKLLH